MAISRYRGSRSGGFFAFFFLNLGHDHCEENRESNSEKEMEMDIGELASATIFILMICLLVNSPY